MSRSKRDLVMELVNLRRETLDGRTEDVWENERTPTPVQRFEARLRLMGLSVRETEAVLGRVGVQRSYGAVWRWNHRLADVEDQPTAQSRRVVVYETAVRIGGTWHWVYAATDVDSKLLLDIDLFSHHGTDSAAAFFHRLTEKHAFSETEFLVDSDSYLTAIS